MTVTCVVGLGLIGASFAQFLTQYTDHTVIGVDTDDETRLVATESGMVSKAFASLIAVNVDVDFIFVATPMSTLIPTITTCLSSFPTAIISDMGSLKYFVYEAFKDEERFVPGHPMTGTEESGISASKADLFVDATYALCPFESDSYTRLKALLATLPLKLIELSAIEHDQIVTQTSHGPYIAAGLPVSTLRVSDSSKALMGPGFRDTTRVSASAVEWAMDVCEYNPYLKDHLIAMRTQLDTIIRQLESRDLNALVSTFSTIRTKKLRLSE